MNIASVIEIAGGMAVAIKPRYGPTSSLLDRVHRLLHRDELHRQHSRQAVVMEAYVNGVSTRKVDRPVEQLGISGMSKDRVSARC